MATYQTVTFDTIIKGSGFNGYVFKFYTDALHTLPIDLTGCTITADLRQTPKAIAQAKWSTEDSTITITGTDDNFVTLVARNINVPVGKYYMDLDILFPSGINKTYVRILWEIIEEYTF